VTSTELSLSSITSSNSIPAMPLLITTGSIKATMKEIDGAIADFNHAIQLNPEFIQAYMNLGSVEANRGDLNAAIVNFNQVVQLDPDSVEAFENLGSAKQERMT